MEQNITKSNKNKTRYNLQIEFFFLDLICYEKLKNENRLTIKKHKKILKKLKA